MRSHRRNPLICAALLACTLPALAADIGSAQLSLNNVTFRLIDLDTSDGVTPGITWNDGYNLTVNQNSYVPVNAMYQLAGGLYATYDTVYEPSTLLPLPAPDAWGPAGYANGGGTLSMSPNNLLAQAQLSSDQLTTKTFTNTSTNSWGTSTETGTSTAGGTRVSFDAWNDGMPPMFTLTANTLLVMEGSLTLNTELNTSVLREFGAAHTNEYTVVDNVRTSSYASGTLYMDSSVSIGIVPLDDPLSSFESSEINGVTVYKEYGPQSLALNTYQGFSTGTLEEGVDVYTRGHTQSFKFVVSNVDAEDLLVGLTTSGSVEIRQSTSIYEHVYTSTPLPAIPEPATYALMGLGLVGITLVRRRRA